MTNTLSERRKADRKVMADRISDLCALHGATCSIRDKATHIWPDGSRPLPEDRNALALSIALDDLRVGIELDGSRGNSKPDIFCLPWNVALDSEKRMSSAFGACQQSEVNPYHRRKCTAFAYGSDELLHMLEAAFLCVGNGSAWESGV